MNTQKAMMGQFVNYDNIVEVLSKEGNFKTLIKALHKANLLKVLESDGMVTIFAPTDEAFSKLSKKSLNNILDETNRKELVNILSYHITIEKVMPNSIENLNGKYIIMLNGEKAKITVQNGEIYINDIKNGMTVIVEGNLYQIVDFLHVKPGKGAAFVRTKLKNIKSGGVVEKTFRPTEKCPTARIDRKDYTYLYADGDLYNFMDAETYEQIALSKDDIGDALKFVKENEMVKMCSHNGSVFAVEPPLFVELQITETEPGFKGDTATGATKPAIVETGATVYVPLFVEQGDVIKIDTRTGEYLSRV